MIYAPSQCIQGTIGEMHNETFSVDYSNTSPDGDEPLALFQVCSWPVYEYVKSYEGGMITLQMI